MSQGFSSNHTGRQSQPDRRWHRPAEFRYCPRCGHPATPPHGNNPFRCAECEFLLYFNPATAVGSLVLNPADEILLIRRSKDPGKGKYGVPGGFVDMGETVEDALVREIREEVNLEVAEIKFLASFPNEYHFHGVAYAVIDMYFTCLVESTEFLSIDPAEVESVHLCRPEEVDEDQMAFASARKAVRLFNALRHKKN